jgi:predicted acylesterase/phospholipase RssA
MSNEAHAQLLEPMLDQTQERYGQWMEEHYVDGGFRSNSNVAVAKQKGVMFYTPIPVRQNKSSQKRRKRFYPVVDLDGEIIAGPLQKEEGLLYTEILPVQVHTSRWMLVVKGNYSRLDIFQLTNNRSPRPMIKTLDPRIDPRLLVSARTAGVHPTAPPVLAADKEE